MATLRIDQQPVEFSQGMTIAEGISKAFPDGYPGGNPLAARIGGEVFNLNFSPRVDGDGECHIDVLTIHRHSGRRVYERSLVFLMLMAMRRLFPGKRVVVAHSLGPGLMIRPELGRPVTPKDVREIEAVMRELVGKDLPLKRERHSIKSAIDHFEKDGQNDKVRLLTYRKYSYFDVYSCEGTVEYLYGEMAPSTGLVDVFSLKYRMPGFMLIMPDEKDASRPAMFRDRPKLSRALEESQQWAEILECDSVADLNDMIGAGKIREFIRINEALHEKSIAGMADDILHRNARAVLIAGPSSSGKTTFTNRLAIQLRVHGKSPLLISLDDYYLDRDAIPVEADGRRDLEAITTLDIQRFNEDLEMLLSGVEVEMPLYDFKTGMRKAQGRRIHLQEGQPVLIEGIHGLNERMSEGIPSDMKYKIYISALMPLNLDDHNRIRSTDARLLRRLVRDFHHRNASMEDTLRMWTSVRNGEDRWIFPFQEQADVIFNSSLAYEISVLKKHIYPLLADVGKESPFYAEARRLVKFLNYFNDADVDDEIPPTSILREFIGGCTFYV